MAKGFGFVSIAPMPGTEIAPPHGARKFAAAVLLPGGTRVLVTGGTGTGFNDQFSAELYDDTAQNWTPSQMILPRSQHTATLLQSGQVLVVGGQHSNVIGPELAEVYSPSTNLWQKVLNNPHARRSAHTATLLPDARVLVTGGDFGGSLATAEIFDPGNDPVSGAWVPVNPMNDARSFHTAILLPNGMVLVAGGTSDGQSGLSSAELFDPTTGT